MRDETVEKPTMDEAAEKFPTRDASPLELAFGGNAWCLRLVVAFGLAFGARRNASTNGGDASRVGNDAMNVHTHKLKAHR